MAQTIAACALTVLLLAGGPLIDRAWAQGGHGTPEHWAYHVLMMGLGLVDHHGTHATDESEGRTGLSYHGDGIAIAAPGPSAVSSVHGTAFIGLLAAAVVIGSLRWRRLLAFESAVPIGQRTRPVDLPPRGR
jgi:hypothetical protein